MKTKTIFGKFTFSSLALIFIIGASVVIPNGNSVQEDTRVYKLLSSLGFDGPDHFPNTEVFGVSANRGKSIVEQGFSTRPGGGSTGKQSKHFVCTSCHNTEREDPDLRFTDPETRLKYTNEKGLPYLQGTSLYGVVNRESFYNDDYYEKYGDLVLPARNNIREAIQLCAVECAQGRKLKRWELESILAYLWTIDLKISDLNLTEKELNYLDEAVKNKLKMDSAVTLIRSKYMKHSPAHFGTAQASKDAVELLNGDTANGRIVYENSCLHCHQNRRYSFLELNDDKITFNHLLKKADNFNSHSVFQVTRYGVYSKAGKRSYMPQYPKEKLSDQQLADLYAYIEMRAKE